MNKYKSILKEIGYESEENALRDIALFQSLSKLDQYKAECEFYERKYGKNYLTLKNETHRIKGREDFELENDLEDWQFAINAVKWWDGKIKELKSANAV